MASVTEYFSTIDSVIISIESPAKMENRVVTLSLTDAKKLTFGKTATPKNVKPRNSMKNDAENSTTLQIESLIS